MALRVSIEVYHSSLVALMDAASKKGLHCSDFDELFNGVAQIVELDAAVDSLYNGKQPVQGAPEEPAVKGPRWARIPGGSITGPQLDLIKKHINGKAKDRIARWLGPLRPSELTKPEASVLLDYITKKEDWPQWTF